METEAVGATGKDAPLIALIGATGKTGRHVLSGALERGLRVRALSRNPGRLTSDGNLSVVRGDVSDPDAVRKLIEGVDVVLSCLGTTQKPHYIVDKGVGVVLGAIDSSASKPRFIHISALGLCCSRPQCEKSLRWSFVVKWIYPLVGRDLFADMEKAEHRIADARDLDWVIVRLPVLNNGPARGYRALSSQDSAGSLSISRRDVADFMLSLITDKSWDGKPVSLFSA